MKYGHDKVEIMKYGHDKVEIMKYGHDKVEIMYAIFFLCNSTGYTFNDF
jgi:hypothetical protein